MGRIVTGRQDMARHEDRRLRLVRDPEDGMTLAEQTARRLILAGIKEDDPGLVAIREWNKAAYERAARTDTSDDSDKGRRDH